LEIFEYLLTFPGIQQLVNCPDKWGETPLLIAIKAQKIEMVKLLFEYHADVAQITSHKKTALHYAVHHKNMKLIELILSQKAGSDLCHRYDNWGKLPIHCAFNINRNDFGGLIKPQNSLSIVEMLSPYLWESEIIKPDRNGKTPLQESVKILPKHHLEWLLNHGGHHALLLTDNYGKTVLHEAAKWGNVDAIHLILDHGGKILVNQCDRYGKTPLHDAAIYCSIAGTPSPGNIEAVTLLLELGAYWDQKSESGDITAFEEVYERLGIEKTLEIFSPYLSPQTKESYLQKWEEKKKRKITNFFPTNFFQSPIWGNVKQ